jgi:hypothetical protein
MANGLEKDSGVSMFSEEELREMSGVKFFDDYVEVMCGCTSHRYGDAVGRLRVYFSGFLQIICECTPGCQEGFFLSLYFSLIGFFVLMLMCMLIVVYTSD